MLRYSCPASQFTLKWVTAPIKYKKNSPIWARYWHDSNISSQKQLCSCGTNVQRFVGLLLPISPHFKVLITDLFIFQHYYLFVSVHCLSVQELRASILSPISGDYTCMIMRACWSWNQWWEDLENWLWGEVFRNQISQKTADGKPECWFSPEMNYFLTVSLYWCSQSTECVCVCYHTWVFPCKVLLFCAITGNTGMMMQ